MAGISGYLPSCPYDLGSANAAAHRKDIYEKTLLFYVERCVKGTEKNLGVVCGSGLGLFEAWR